MSYTLTIFGGVVRDSDGANISPDPTHPDRIEYDEWLAAGGVPNAVSQEVIAASVRGERDSLIAAVQWRYERHARETRLGLKPTDDIAVLDAYVQALADVPKQKGFPGKVKWPVLAG